MANPLVSEEHRPQADLDSLHRELIEARNLAIKTDNLVKNLNADIKLIARQQEAYQRRYLFNSSVAYVLFVVIIFTGLYLAFNAKLSAHKADVEHYRARNELIETRLDEVQTDLDNRRETEERAFDFFQLLEEGSPSAVVEEFSRLQTQLTDRTLVALFRERVEHIHFDLSEEAYRTGVQQIQIEEWSAARDSFLASMSYDEQTPWLPELNYYLGRALFNLEDYEGAVYYFDEALDSQELDDAQRARAMYNRGTCLENTGRLAEATVALQAFRSEYPNNRYAGRALRHINGIQREINRTLDTPEE
jgi:TolA-binding protein